MVSHDPVVSLHSVAEAFLYLMAARCTGCGFGPLKPQGNLTRTSHCEAPWRLLAECPQCGRCEPVSFLIDPVPTREQARSAVVNPTALRSRAIDLEGWVTLFQTILAAAGEQRDRALSREVLSEALSCLEEALKFYGPGEDLPGGDAFFNEASRKGFLAHPERYARGIWEQRRAILVGTLGRTEAHAPPRRWYQFWRK